MTATASMEIPQGKFKVVQANNIKNISVISDSMKIFIELLAEYSYISVDINNALNENTTLPIAEELPKIYLYDYYSMIDNLRTNKNIIKKFRDWNIALNPSLYPVGLPYIGEKLFNRFENLRFHSLVTNGFLDLFDDFFIAKGFILFFNRDNFIKFKGLYGSGK